MTRFSDWQIHGTETARPFTLLTASGPSPGGDKGQFARHIWHYVGMEKLAWQHLSSSFSASSELSQAEHGNTVNTKIYPFLLIGLDDPKVVVSTTRNLLP